jgi:hypothetical protein
MERNNYHTADPGVDLGLHEDHYHVCGELDTTVEPPSVFAAKVVLGVAAFIFGVGTATILIGLGVALLALARMVL